MYACVSDYLERLRRWICELENYMSAEDQAKLTEEAEKAGVEMVKKTVDSDGRTRVCKT